MSDRAVPLVAFGFQIGAEQEVEIAGLDALIEATHNCEDKGWPVELVASGHHEYKFWFLSVRGTSIQAGDWGDEIKLAGLITPTDGEIQSAREWCAAHNIEWEKPCWCAMAAYT